MSVYDGGPDTQRDVQNAVYAGGALGGLALVAAFALLIESASAEGLAAGALLVGALIPGLVAAALFLTASGLRRGGTNAAKRTLNMLNAVLGLELLAVLRALTDGSPVGAVGFAVALAATFGVSHLVSRAVRGLEAEGRPEAP